MHKKTSPVFFFCATAKYLKKKYISMSFSSIRQKNNMKVTTKKYFPVARPVASVLVVVFYRERRLTACGIVNGVEWL